MSTLLDAPAPPVEAKASPVSVDLNREQPWPGLFPFREEHRDYFYGRAEEADDLSHCVKRDTITLLFGKSGLGKSSLLLAGLFPLLRDSGFLPVYIKLSFAEDVPPLITQVKTAVQDAILRSNLDEVSLPGEDQSLWEYLHQRGPNLVDHAGQAVCPVVVFDQFEEIFTLGNSSDAARELRDQFLDRFAELVENFIPQGLRERLAEDPKLAERFDFSSSGCRIVVAMREDYLPKLEKLRTQVPSLVFATSRMRLTEMNGLAALDAVSRPNPKLVPGDVAEHIVRFVAGDTSQGEQKLEALEVPPAILSLFCHELNRKRLEASAEQITDELVSGNAKTIISDFYADCIKDQPTAVQRLIEDKLVTKWGYRDNIDLRQAREELKQQGVSSAALDKLVTKRLLRIEEYGHAQRVELTHDVLVQPVLKSREKRIQEEAVELARQHEREVLEAEKLRARRLKQWLMAGAFAGLIVLALLVISVRLWRLAEGSSLSANAALVEAEQNARRANTERKRADENARNLEIEAIKAAGAQKTAEEQTIIARREEAKVQQAFELLEGAYLDSLTQCDDSAGFFSELASTIRQGAEGEGMPELAADFSKLFERYVGQCVGTAKKLHSVKPDDVEVASYPGAIYLEMADSAIDRKDPVAAKEYSMKAVEVAEELEREPGRYKSHLVAAKIYGGASYRLWQLKDPSATQTGDRGIQVLNRAQTEQGTAKFDAWDWDATARVYMYRAIILPKPVDHAAAIALFQKAFDAESLASTKDRRPAYLERASLLGRKLAEEHAALKQPGLANQWYGRALNIANERISLLPGTITTQSQLTELQGAFADAGTILNAQRDWRGAAANRKREIELCLALKNKIKDRDLRDNIDVEVSRAYGNLAWYEILISQPEDSLKYAAIGISLDPSQVWIKVNQAHALLFTNRGVEAATVYLNLADTTYERRKLVKDIHDDFQLLCEMNLVRPEMANIARELGIDDPALMTCLASAGAQE